MVSGFEFNFNMFGERPANVRRTTLEGLRNTQKNPIAIKQDSFTLIAEIGCKVYGGCGLCNAAFKPCNGDYFYVRNIEKRNYGFMAWGGVVESWVFY